MKKSSSEASMGSAGFAAEGESFLYSSFSVLQLSNIVPKTFADKVRLLYKV